MKPGWRCAPVCAFQGSDPRGRRRPRGATRSALENDHLPYRLAIGQAVEAEIDLVELDAMRHQAVDRQPPRAVKRDVVWDVARRRGRTEKAVFERAFLDHQIDRRDVE